MTVPLHVVAGFLGAGKTTVVRRWLANLPGRTGVVVNDFGEAGVDAALLSTGGALREIAASCVCCTAPEGFVAAVAELVADGVDRIIVEPTGLARPADLVDTLRRSRLAARLDLRPLLVLVDPHVLATGGLPADATEQAGAADVLVMTHADLATVAERQAFHAFAATLWPGPHVTLEVAHGELPAEVLVWPEGRGPRAGSHGHPHRHSEEHEAHGFVVRSWAWPPDTVFHRGRLRSGLETLEVERVKGLFRTDEGTVLLQKAGGRLYEEPTGWRSDGRVDVIARATSALDAAEEVFEAARWDPAEAEARGSSLEVAGPAGTRVFDRAQLATLAGPADVSVVAPGRKGAAAWLVGLLGEVAPDASLVVVAADGYVTAPVAISDLSGAVLLHTYEGGPLPDAQGGPFRLLVPGGATAAGPCANVKGVVRLAVRSV